ncbi:YoaK family protein [Oceanivirga miroungae]|uniref:Permease n=1 Tax=Oceanivirga miroungae TaxID=1130046 RepID=A0A6I8MCX2_9FUSO|nr:YoaK family protein [Oceanivirga miroungae]VWL85290.1 hypothetical protein OMES3154_00573 [Oceanivirga miroungae]
MKSNQSSDSLKIALLLTFIGGFLEIYSFLLKGKVFATTMTGNIIMMMYNVYNLDFLSIPKYLFPIICFCLGIIYVEYIKKKYFNHSIHWREFILALEIFLVILVFLFRKEYFNIFTTSIIGFMSAIQIQSFKKTEDNLYMSTMLTGNTRKLIESIIKKNTKQVKIFTLIILSFCVGVIFGALFIDSLKEASILILLLPLITIFYLIHKNI